MNDLKKYEVWRKRLLTDYEIDPRQTRAYSLGLAALSDLMTHSNVEFLEFQLMENENDFWRFKIRLNESEHDGKHLPAKEWAESFREMKKSLNLINVEKGIEVLAKNLIDNSTQEQKVVIQWHLPGLDIFWQRENLTSNTFLEHILTLSYKEKENHE
jgi:hypothetical protein